MRPVDRTILAIAVPAFATLVSEPLMLLVDTAVVGRLGTTPLAGLGAAATVLSTVVGLCVFLAYTGTATVARLLGAGRPAEAASAALGSLWLALGLGVVLGIALAAVAPPLARAMTATTGSADAARSYLVLSTLAVPAMLLSLAATGALRGSLDLRTPLAVTISANGLNAVLSIALVHGIGPVDPRLGIAGAALATVVAQWAGAAALVAVVALRSRTDGASWRPDGRAMLRAAAVGGPLLVRTVTLRAALLIAVVLAARLGDVPLAAHQIATTLVGLLAFALDAIAIAGQTLTGRALGAADVGLTRDLTRRMIGWGVATGALAGVALAALSPVLGSWFVADERVHEVLVPALLVVAVVQPVSGIVFVLDGTLIGAGDGVYLAWAGLATLAAYVPLAVLVVIAGGGLVWLWVAYGGFQLARLVTLWLRQRGDHWLVTGASTR